MKVLNAKLREKFIEALKAVLPIVAIVLILGFTIAPVTPSVLLCFLVGTVMVMAGMMFFTLGAEMSMTPMGEKVGACMTKSKKIIFIVIMSFVLGVIITISEPDLQVLASQVPSVPNMTLILYIILHFNTKKKSSKRFILFRTLPLCHIFLLAFLHIFENLLLF